MAALIGLIYWYSSTPPAGSMAALMGGSNILVNGALAGPLIPLVGGTAGDEMTITGWKLNNARISLVDWPVVNGRPNVIKVADGGSFTEMVQTVDTVIGQKYTISYDVWAADTETNTANNAFCSTSDSNGQLIIRQGETVNAGVAGGGNCGSAHVGGIGSIGEHCHGQHRLCPESSDHWLTVSGTYTATGTRTTLALHGEGSLDVYFSQVFMTTAKDECRASTDSVDPDDPTMCQCSHLKEAQTGTGNVRTQNQGASPCDFTSGNTGKTPDPYAQAPGYSQYNRAPNPPPPGVTNWMDGELCRTVPPPSCIGSTDQQCATSHQQNGMEHVNSICVDVVVPPSRFTFTPHFVASFGGTGSEHHMTTGASSVYHASPTGFRVYIKKEACTSCVSSTQQTTGNTALTAALAKQRGYHINWVAETAPCSGAGDSTGAAQYGQGYGQTPWETYCWNQAEYNANPTQIPLQCTGVHTTITFPVGAFSETPTIVASLHGHSNHVGARGANGIYGASANGFSVYVHSTSGTGALHNGVQQAGLSVNDVNLWGWKIVYLATTDTQHSGQSSGSWIDGGEHLCETIVCHGGNGHHRFTAGSTVNVRTHAILTTTCSQAQL